MCALTVSYVLAWGLLAMNSLPVVSPPFLMVSCVRHHLPVVESCTWFVAAGNDHLLPPFGYPLSAVAAASSQCSSPTYGAAWGLLAMFAAA